MEELLVRVVLKVQHEVDGLDLLEALGRAGRRELLLEHGVADARHVRSVALGVSLCVCERACSQ